MKYLSLILPFIIIAVVTYASSKKVKVYDSFVDGAKKGVETVFSILPYLVVVFIMTELFTVSGLSAKFTNLISPVFKILGIPKEITPLVILKPFSGSGSLALLTEIFKTYGVDSYVSRCACAVFGSSETIFYVSAVYFSKSKEKRLTRPILISLASTLFSTVIACFICKFI
ncbi:MAG: spore maturation protein [Clostridia bacterium]|nr:spore maturation protein [Clostridia bacterium]